MLREKWDWALPQSLLMKSFASISLDISTAILLHRVILWKISGRNRTALRRRDYARTR